MRIWFVAALVLLLLSASTAEAHWLEDFVIANGGCGAGEPLLNRGVQGARIGLIYEKNINTPMFEKPLLQWSDEDLATAARIYNDCEAKLHNSTISNCTNGGHNRQYCEQGNPAALGLSMAQKFEANIRDTVVLARNMDAQRRAQEEAQIKVQQDQLKHQAERDPQKIPDQGAHADELKDGCVTALSANCAPGLNNCTQAAGLGAYALLAPDMQSAANQIVQQLPNLPVEPYFRDPNSGLMIMARQFTEVLFRQRGTMPPRPSTTEYQLYNTLSALVGNPKAAMMCFPALRQAGDQWGKQLLEAKAKAEAQAQQQAAERQAIENLPANFLGNSYIAYIVVKRCYDARAGYAAVYVSEPEMRQAKEAIKLIEDGMKPQLSTTDTVEQIWAKADQQSKRNVVFQMPTFGQDMTPAYLCKQNLRYLVARADKLDPTRTATPKDFD